MGRRRKRRFNVFNLAFLDIMSCGFGAVILFFVIINHATEVRSDDFNADLLGEVQRLEEEVLYGELNLVKLRNSDEEIQRELVIAEGRARQLNEQVELTEQEIAERDADTNAREANIRQLVAELRQVEEDIIEAESIIEERGDALREISGEGDRQYLTGMRMGGGHVLVLVDSSASMLADTLVNVIRRRNLSDDQKRRAAKWQRAVRAVNWAAAQIPEGTNFQIYTFNTRAEPLLKGTDGQWLVAEREGKLGEALQTMRTHVPEDGTSLINAFSVISRLNPIPDNVFLVVDGLPTQGPTAPGSGGLVTARDRLKLFERAVSSVPVGVPINVILFPMEGDPRAASAYWQLAQATGGSFMSPAGDWP